jgi:hypothetical protein
MAGTSVAAARLSAPPSYPEERAHVWLPPARRRFAASRGAIKRGAVPVTGLPPCQPLPFGDVNSGAMRLPRFFFSHTFESVRVAS